MEWWGLHIYIWTSLYWTINSFFVSNTISFYSCTDKGGMYDKGVSPLSSTKTYLKKSIFLDISVFGKGGIFTWKVSSRNLQNILFWTFACLCLPRVKCLTNCERRCLNIRVENVESVMGRKQWYNISLLPKIKLHLGIPFGNSFTQKYLRFPWHSNF